jgi:hypothetical protein
MKSASAIVLAAMVAGGCKKAEKEGPIEPPGTQPGPEPKPAEVPAEAPDQPRRIGDIGLSTPESVLYDAGLDLYLVSNINGTPFDKDGNGFVSQVGPDGKMVELKWIDGAAEKVTLNAPKGMVIQLGTLYLADIDTVRMFDAVTGAPKGEIPIKGASFLNDVTSHDGVVYVSDSGLKPGEDGFAPSGTDAVYAIGTDRKPKKILSGGDLAGPNGLLATPDGLYMVSFAGKGLSRIDPAAKKREQLADLPHGGNDGVVLADGRLVISSWECQCLMAGPPEGPFEVVAEDLKTPADLAWDSKRNRLVVPHFEENALTFLPLAAAKASPAADAPAADAPAVE